MLDEMDHPFADGEPVYDVTFENVQAGLRTDYLFRLANQRGGIVLGTGDLSELALGWCTYGVGDQMSHYNVNGGVPKTLMQHLIRWVISSEQFARTVSSTLQAILDTEITPELVPAGEGETPQSTEAAIGPYSLQDFTLFHVLRYGMKPSQDRLPRLARLARRRGRATGPRASPTTSGRPTTSATIKKWLEVFCKRFFGFAQFKRSALPNGPKVVRRRFAVAARRLARPVRHLRRRSGWRTWPASQTRNRPSLPVPTDAERPRSGRVPVLTYRRSTGTGAFAPRSVS